MLPVFCIIKFALHSNFIIKLCKYYYTKLLVGLRPLTAELLKMLGLRRQVIGKNWKESWNIQIKIERTRQNRVKIQLRDYQFFIVWAWAGSQLDLWWWRVKGKIMSGSAYASLHASGTCIYILRRFSRLTTC